MLAVGAIESMMYVLLATGDTAVVAGSTATALTVVVAFTRTTIGPTTPPVVAGVVPSVVTLISAVGSGDATTTDWEVLYAPADRKSTRLNSSHVSNSYAVLCLKKKILAGRYPS